MYIILYSLFMQYHSILQLISAIEVKLFNIIILEIYLR